MYEPVMMCRFWHVEPRSASTYDASGRVIVLEPLAPDKLPAFKAQPRLELIEDAAPAGKKPGGFNFSREDMGARRMDPKQAAELISQARQLDSRFDSSTQTSFL